MSLSTTRRKRHIGRWVLLPLLLAALALALWDGQTRLVTDRYTCQLSSLPESFEGFRIVQVSDLHGASFGAGNRRLVERVRAEKPDLIALTGDMTACEADLAVTAQLLPQLAQIAPCYYVSGNHEWGSGTIDALAAQMEQSGVVYLQNEYLPLARGGETLVLCGVEDPNSWADLTPPDELVEELRGEYPDECVLLLGHRNCWMREYPTLDVDVILCGHGHGGLIRLPWVGGLIGTDRRFFPDYTEGCFTGGRYAMVVSRGMGNLPYTLRLFNNPELVTVTLERQA